MQSAGAGGRPSWERKRGVASRTLVSDPTAGKKGWLMVASDPLLDAASAHCLAHAAPRSRGSRLLCRASLTTRKGVRAAATGDAVPRRAGLRAGRSGGGMCQAGPSLECPAVPARKPLRSPALLRLTKREAGEAAHVLRTGLPRGGGKTFHHQRLSACIRARSIRSTPAHAPRLQDLRARGASPPPRRRGARRRRPGWRAR